MSPSTLPQPLPRLIAHRCGGVWAPENTLAGLRAAAARGFCAVEFDVMLAADGVPLLIHDETLERTTSGRGRVAERRAAELFELDAGGGERIPSLAAAAELTVSLGLFANVEIKPAAGQARATGRAVGDYVSTSWPGARLPLLSSFSRAALAEARRAAPAAPLGLLYERVPPDWVADLTELGAACLICAAAGIDDATIAAAQARRVPLLCYTVNDAGAAAALWQRGVSALFTDCLLPAGIAEAAGRGA